MNRFDHDLNLSVEAAIADDNKEVSAVWGTRPGPPDAISLRALRDRLSFIIEENEKRGRPEQNNRAVVLEFHRNGHPWVIPVKYACNGSLTVGGVITNALVGYEDNTFKSGRRQKKG